MLHPDLRIQEVQQASQPTPVVEDVQPVTVAQALQPMRVKQPMKQPTRVKQPMSEERNSFDLRVQNYSILFNFTPTSRV